MRLQDNTCYFTRDGRRVGPIERIGDEDDPKRFFTAHTVDNLSPVWDPDGTADFFGDGRRDLEQRKWDLVSIAIRDGMTYRARDGRVFGPIRPDEDGDEFMVDGNIDGYAPMWRPDGEPTFFCAEGDEKALGENSPYRLMEEVK